MLIFLSVISVSPTKTSKLNPSGEGPTVKSGASTTIPTNLMPSLTQTVTSTTNGSTGSRSGSIPNTVTAMPPQSTGTMTQDHLQPKSNISANLSSNSSLNSSSVKSTTSKSNDGASIEKKHKSTSRSRQKKFHRHFKQVAIDEEVINCKFFFSFSFSLQTEFNHFSHRPFILQISRAHL